LRGCVLATNAQTLNPKLNPQPIARLAIGCVAVYLLGAQLQANILEKVSAYSNLKIM
jgi:hypothetical protein